MQQKPTDTGYAHGMRSANTFRIKMNWEEKKLIASTQEKELRK